ncbi:MAG: hypothetical protein WAV38_07585, partial [Xanthobacteraceae bacterium]
ALTSYNARIEETSISGISSGAFMSVQFGVAWSSIIKGVGVVAGGPYYCAQASSADLMNGYTLPVATATGPCMRGPPPNLAPMYDEAESQAAAGAIDPLDNIKRQQIYLFHGYNDSVVDKPVTDAAAEFYRHYLGDRAHGTCWDWWSYVRHDDGYITKRGLQIAAIKSMLDVLTAGRKLSASGTPEQSIRPAFLITDTSDNAAALAWTRVPGAAAYRISRSDAGGAFRVIGETERQSFGDQGLAAATHYAWRVTAIVDGNEQTPFADAEGTTLAKPPACTSPGTCP